MFETRFGLTMKKKLKRDDTKRVRVYVDVALHDVPESPSRSQAQAQAPPPSSVLDEEF
jgi:putative DNA primase/helicase